MRKNRKKPPSCRPPRRLFQRLPQRLAQPLAPKPHRPVALAQSAWRFSLQQVLESGESVVGIDRIQPVLTGMQLALTALWMLAA